MGGRLGLGGWWSPAFGECASLPWLVVEVGELAVAVRGDSVGDLLGGHQDAGYEVDLRVPADVLAAVTSGDRLQSRRGVDVDHPQVVLPDLHPDGHRRGIARNDAGPVAAV